MSWVETTFSQTFDTDRSLKIGLKLLRTVGSRLGFFKTSWNTACLKVEWSEGNLFPYL